MYVIMRVNIIYILGTISYTINNTSLQIHKFDRTVGIKKGKDTKKTRYGCGSESKPNWPNCLNGFNRATSGNHIFIR